MGGGRDHRDLTDIWLFEGCTGGELRRLGNALVEVTVAEGTLLVEEGEPAYVFFVVVEGRATVRRGKQRVADLGPGDFFGELSLLDRQPRSASVTAATDMDLLLLKQRDFQRLLTAVPQLSRKLLSAMAGRLRESEARVYS